MPYVCEHVRPTSAVDFGCGVGVWLHVARDCGAERIQGFDDGQIDTENAVIPSDRIRTIDFESDVTIMERFDLAICLEVAGHVSEPRAGHPVKLLCDTASFVLFSAAIPFQGGTGHVNEQWTSYWIAKFEKENFVALDCIRPVFRDDTDVEWWYAQNTFLMVERSVKHRVPHLLHHATNAFPAAQPRASAAVDRRTRPLRALSRPIGGVERTGA